MNKNLQATRTFCDFVREVVSTESYSEKNNEKMKALVGSIDDVFAQNHGFWKIIPVVKKAFLEKNYLKTMKNLEKIESRNHPFANDFPFKENNIVAVVRYEHGWMDGNMIAKIVKCEMSTTGNWSYVAQVQKDDGTYYDDYFVPIDHTRDAYLI